MASRPSQIGHVLTSTDHPRLILPLTTAADQEAEIWGDTNNVLLLRTPELLHLLAHTPRDYIVSKTDLLTRL